MSGDLTPALARLEARLQPDGCGPVAVAWSGGGDSTALLRLARAWADRHGRPLIALTVDHGLQPAGAAWARACAARAAELGVRHRILAWTGDKPATGLPAAARAARHRLLACAAREAGAGVLLLGHTADDVLEARAMREAGSSVPDPREWAPSPVWPEGRGLMLLRPLLGVRRAAIRAWLAARGEAWIEDPANDDPRFARARARQSLSQSLEPAPAADIRRGPPAFGEAAGGALAADRSAVTDPAALAAAMVCAGGGARPPRRAAVLRLLHRLEADGEVTATLAGARLVADGARVLVAREAGDFRRRGLAAQGLEPGRARVWDGRFEITAHRPGLAVAPLAGHAARLPKAERAALARLPAAVRGGLPVILDGNAASCPLLAQASDVVVRGLVFERFRAAMGLICREAAIPRVAKAPVSP